MDKFIFIFLKDNPTPIKLSYYNFNKNIGIERYLSHKNLHFVGILSSEEIENLRMIPFHIRRFDG